MSTNKIFFGFSTHAVQLIHFFQIKTSFQASSLVMENIFFDNNSFSLRKYKDTQSEATADLTFLLLEIKGEKLVN